MEDIKKKVQMVVARYNEDVRWLLPFKDIVILYNKGIYEPLLNNFNTIYLKNYGRESHTYLYHIITNYHNLTDKIIFFQGKIDDHKVLSIEDYFGRDPFIGKFNQLDINSLKNHIEHIGKWKKFQNNGSMRICKHTPYHWLSEIIGLDFGSNENMSKIIWGANFSLSKDLILSKPIEFYKNILRYLEYHENPEEGHYLERGWYLLFNSNYKKKDRIGYIFKYYSFPKEYKEYKQYKEIHIWKEIYANSEVGVLHKINYIPANTKYLLIQPDIVNNEFTLHIKAKNDAHILIELTEEFKYEIILGGWNNNKSVIKDYNKNKIIYTYENIILDMNQFINFRFIIDDKIKIYKDNTLLFDVKNIFHLKDIKNIRIKSSFHSDSFWDYNENDKIKYFLVNNQYEYQNIHLFYQNHYIDYYVEDIGIVDSVEEVSNISNA
jgi:hypothetical protein